MKREEILNLLEKAKEIERHPEKADAMPQNTFYIEKDSVLCCKRDDGESRFPYDSDGLVVWIYSTGFISAVESTFTIFRSASFGEESPVAFFGGIKEGDGKYTPVSITGAGRRAVENGVSRYVFYFLKHAVCIADTPDVVFAFKLYVDAEKRIHMETSAVNKTDGAARVYLASFVEAMLRNAEFEKFWNKMTKFGKILDNGSFMLMSRNETDDILVIKKKISGEAPSEIYSTASRSVFLGSRGLSVSNALSLVEGKFKKEAPSVTTTDLPAASDIIHFDLSPRGAAFVSYEMTVCHSEAEALEISKVPVCAEKRDAELSCVEKKEKEDFDNLKINFGKWKTDGIKSGAFNKFLRSVQKQTSFCAHGKNYAGAYLGIRDVFQQLEGALIWQREISREKILSAMNYILDTGRPPRMFSFPKTPDSPIPVDLEKYIDQGVWIISALYTYLAYTRDFSILDEKCGYIDAPDEPWCNAVRTGEETTLAEHLIRITDFLISNIDDRYTGALRVLFGDWNDAVDGLGRTKDEGEEFGSGVTVMATLQFWQNLREMTQILGAVGGYDDKCERYREISEKIERGLERYAIDTAENGERRIIHGWGDKVSYKVGSFCDPDGVSRYSLTPNAFWAITGFLRRDPSLKAEILKCFDAVSSKYGLKTFDKPFPKDCEGVGRITNIVPGTYENSCAYAHASLFGTMAMFEVGESRRAWEEIEKTAVITHKNASMTSFVMPNSYTENPEYCMDGESLGDWHTGSGAVLIKETVKYAFGIYPTLDGLYVRFPSYFPAEDGEIELTVGNSHVKLCYKDEKRGERALKVSGAEGFTESFDSLMNIPVIFIPSDKMGDEINITVTD